MQGLTLTAISATEKRTLKLDSTLNHNKVTGARNLGQGVGHSACLESMSRTITMQGLTLTAITTTEKRTLMLDSA